MRAGQPNGEAETNVYDMVGGDMARVTSLGNGPMDSVQVGKAVFVKCFIEAHSLFSKGSKGIGKRR